MRDKRVATPAEIVTKWTLKHVAWLKGLTLPPCARMVLDDLLAEIDDHAQRRDTLDARLEQVTADDIAVAQVRAHCGA